MNKKILIFHNKLFNLLIIIATLLMGIGYASVNSVTLDIAGKVTAKEQDGVYIKSVKYIKDNNANLELSKINNYYQTMLYSSVALSSTDTSSSITYYITIYNNSDKNYYFKDTLFSDAFYDNKDITFSLEGLEKGDIIDPHSELSFSITFKYNNNITEITNNILNSYLNFKFSVPSNMKGVTSRNYNGEFWKYKASITNIVFQNTISDIDGAISFDVSEAGDGTVMSRLVSNGDDTYTLYLQSDSIISAPANSSYLFYNFSKLQNIENIEYLNTSKVTNMSYMFSVQYNGRNNLNSLDWSNFDTSKVTSMAHMFECRSMLTNINVSNFNTSKVTNMSAMFRGCKKLISVNVSSFDTKNVTDMNMLFYDCNSLTTLELSNFDTSSTTNMGYMFGALSSITKLNLSNFNTSKVTDMYSMFYNCSKLIELNVSNFNTLKVTNMSNMFMYCSQLKSLDLSSFDMANVTNKNGMLYSTNNVKDAYARTDADASILNAISGKPTTYTFIVRS